MSKSICEYCGEEKATTKILTSNNCAKHPSGTYKGKHKLYEGSEKNKYECKYCGEQKATIKILTSNKCGKHPLGFYKGNHSPAI
jgi:hypothetical protein